MDVADDLDLIIIVIIFRWQPWCSHKLEWRRGWSTQAGVSPTTMLRLLRLIVCHDVDHNDGGGGGVGDEYDVQVVEAAVMSAKASPIMEEVGEKITSFLLLCFYQF